MGLRAVAREVLLKVLFFDLDPGKMAVPEGEIITIRMN
jgi:hypothetical protein